MHRRLVFYGRASFLFLRLFIYRPLAYLLWLPPQFAPPAVKPLARRERMIQYPAVVVMIAMFYACIRADLIGIGFVVLIAMGIGMRPLRRWARRDLTSFEEAVRRNNFAHCLNCGYCVAGLPAEHTCPECGTPYRLGRLEADWVRYFNMNHRPF